jgi:hypothetical protein
MPKGQRQKEKTHCPSGHPYSTENTVIYRGTKCCRSCSRIRNSERREKYKTILDLARDRPCTDCKIKYLPHIMQFDHLPQYKKLFAVSLGRDYPVDKVLKEIAKCEVVCANCHAERTWQRRNG